MMNPFLSLLILFSAERAELRHLPYTFYVKPVASGTGNGFSWANASANLQGMIDMADSLTTIWVAEGIYQPGSGQSFVMKRGVKIYGGFVGTETNISQRDPGTHITTLQGNGASVIYNNNNALNSASILDGFYIVMGNASVGGGVYNNNASPTIANCIFQYNAASTAGGAMYNDNNSSPSINRCSFALNNASSGAAMYNNDNCSPVISDCLFSRNGQQQQPGDGAIMNRNNAPVITGCSFIGSTSWDAGRVIHNTNSSATISRCHFTNGGTAGDPIVINEYSPVSITGCSFSGIAGIGIENNHSDITVRDCSFRAGHRAGISNNNSNPAITNCLFAGNMSYSEASCLYNNASSPVVSNCTFSGNRSTGTSTIVNAASSAATFNNCIIWGNNHAIVNINSTPVVQYSIVQGGYSGTGNLDANPMFVDERSYTEAPFTGGDFALQPVSPAYNAGSNAAVPAGVVTDLDNKPRIVDNIVDMGVFEYRVSPAAGNILYVDHNSGSNNRDGNSWANAFTDLFYTLQYAKVRESSWTTANPLRIFVSKGSYLPQSRPDNVTVRANATDRNKAFLMIPHVQWYGGFDPAQGIDSLDDARIFGADGTTLSADIGAVNDSTDNTYHVIVSSGNVGTARLDGFTVAAGNAGDTGAIFVNGYAINRGWGGGMLCNTSSPALTNCTFSRNWAVHGGGMFNFVASPVISSSQFVQNSSHFGGAIFNHTGSAPVITGVVFSGNRVYSFGGAVYNNNPGQVASYSNCSFSGNYAVNNGSLGGGMFNNNSAPFVSQCSFTGNTATNGGGIYNYQAALPVIENCLFNTNTAGLFGGGIYNEQQAGATIRRCVFSGNYAQFGGGMLNSGTAAITGCTFTNNTVASYGGGVYNLGTGIIATYTNCIFSGNSTVNYGGAGAGAFNNGMMVTYTNCTFYGNNGTLGAAIHNWTTTTTNVRNCLVWGNSSAIGNESSGIANVRYSNVQGGYTGTGNLNIDPLYVNSAVPPGPDGIWATADDGLRLQPCSPAINTGSNVLIAPGTLTDIGGALRVQFLVVDMGAFEAGTPCGSLMAVRKAVDRENLTVDNETGLRVYPNPATDKVYIRDGTTGHCYRVFDNMGRQVKMGRINSTLQGIGLNGLSGGIYYIEITGAGGAVKKLKLLKQ